ncbi:DUF748 domain-containing protein [Alkalimarinus sediminis]|uniref:DUF748 domain-containing protein n=1 Tax=Alkalimarinus sediminis TaxID=1632866 RepID=A0A9E8HLK5_9ALTE|nr:DUF748 domain-containing protein [Alkalimarinus sediminis]UZW75106.1 DUF748 domain-containing protein [Alkalimarinus sediminis]
MHSFSKITSRYWYRSRLFWLLFLLSTYALVGFLVLPGVIKNIAIEQIEQNLGWQGSIDKVELNPFALTLTVNQFAIQDEQGDSVVAFDRYHTNIQLRSIIEGAVTFSNFELAAPFIKLVIDENGKTNFHKAIEKARAKRPEEVAKTDEGDSKPPKLLFDTINVIGGEIEVIDHTQEQLIEHHLKPITFALTNFSTYANKSGAYQLEIALGTGQHLAWNGNIGIAPFHSSGFLKVSNLRAERLWTYAQSKAPYKLTHGLVGFEGQYAASMDQSAPIFELSNATITMEQLQVALKTAEETFLDIEKLTVGPLDFNLAKQKLDISRLVVDALSLKIERNAEGQLTILAPLSKTSNNETQEAAVSNEIADADSTNDTAQPFLWSIGEIQLNNSALNIADLQPSTAANISIDNINSRLSGLSQDMTKSLDFGLSYYIENSEKSEITGQITPTPFDLKAAINFDKLALSTIQPYLNDHVRITIEDGALSVNGNLTLAAGADSDAMTGDFAGSININNFETIDQSVKERLVGWQDLSIEPIKINFNPLAIDISDIRFEQPYGRIIVTNDRSTNLAQLAVSKPEEATQPTTAEPAPEQPDSASAQSEGKPVPVKISRILFNNGAAYFADLSLKPQFGTSIQNISGEISGLSSDNLERASVDIKGTVEDYGKALVKGKINPLSGDLYTDLAVKFDNIELSTMTPYSGRYAGYTIDKGKLNLHLNYKIAKRMLEGENRLILDQFELGNTVDSEESVNLPLELALAILKDRNGVIDIDLPTSGNMDDPDFKFSGLVLKAFANVITKAATAPFSMIGSLVGGDAESLQSVSFETGKAELTAEHISNLEKLSKALNSRPQLMLEIRTNIDEQGDSDALKKIKLDNRLVSSSGEQRIATLEKLIAGRVGQPKLDEIKTNTLATTNTSEQAAAENSEQNTAEQAAIEAQAYEKALYDTALETESVSSLELTTLAKQRITSIKTQLIDQHNVTNEQVFALQPSLEGQAKENRVITTFNLSTR